MSDTPQVDEWQAEADRRFGSGTWTPQFAEMRKIVRELAAVTDENAAMRKLIAKFAQGTFTLKHALTADEVQLMAECADVKVQIPKGRGVDLSNPRTVFGPTPQPDHKRRVCGNVDGATVSEAANRILKMDRAYEGLILRYRIHDARKFVMNKSDNVFRLWLMRTVECSSGTPEEAIYIVGEYIGQGYEAIDGETGQTERRGEG